MPNLRRRKFSVQQERGREGTQKVQNDSSTSADLISVGGKSQFQATSSTTDPLISKAVAETDPDSASSSGSLRSSTMKSDTNDSECSSAPDQLHQTQNIGIEDHFLHQSNDTIVNNGKGTKKRSARQKHATEYQTKLTRQHRIKIRCSKRTSPCNDDVNSVPKTTDSSIHCTIGTDVIDWEHEIDTYLLNDSSMLDCVELENTDRASNHSMDDMCRICHGGESVSVELGPLISACACRGTVGRVHVKCLERWLTESGKSRCELCGTRYLTHRVHRYGVPRALLMWILSQNAKQLMVDSLGIMLMSPLAVLAAWLSGRTLAGLMAQDAHVTPWPLASTFVLACMTLVCYYCWIVSAATRHALGWWMWYRSQYEVRLQCDPLEE